MEGINQLYVEESLYFLGTCRLYFTRLQLSCGFCRHVTKLPSFFLSFRFILLIHVFIFGGWVDGGGGPSSFSSSESLLSVFFLLRFVLFFVCRLISSFSASVYVQLLPVNFMCAKKKYII